MPANSRSRDCCHGRGISRDRKQHSSHRRDRDDYDYDDIDEFSSGRRRRRREKHRSQERSPGDLSRGGYESSVDEPHLREQEVPLTGRKEEISSANESPLNSPTGDEGRQHARGRRRRRKGYSHARVHSGQKRDRNQRIRDERRDAHRDSERQRHTSTARTRRREEKGRMTALREPQSSESTNSGSHLLSADALARLDLQYDEADRLEHARAEDAAPRYSKRRKKRPILDEYGEEPAIMPVEQQRMSKGRVASGAHLEEGKGPGRHLRRRGGGSPSLIASWRKGRQDINADDIDRRPWWKRKRRWIVLAAVALSLAIIIPIAVVFSKDHGDSRGSGSDTSNPDPNGEGDGPSNSNLGDISPGDIPESARGTVLDPFTWYETTGFNVTYTNETVGGLSIMGLNSTWDDSARPNEHVPPLNEPFPYGERPFRGVNLGGWLSIEPFITPSLFDQYSLLDGVIDEWTLSKTLGSSAAKIIEKHYASFIKEEDFAEIRDTGMDHVRIQYSYWAVTTYEGDPYVAKISWRYLLRAIEYCRKYGLRVKLDFHGIPGSQNGWNHSGRQGIIRWINSTEGELNRQRSLENHDQLSKFFAQDRYKNVLAIYGLVNEPLMLDLPINDVLNWSVEATNKIQANGVKAYIAIHDGFLNLDKWRYMLPDRPPRMMLDTHQYTIFNMAELGLNHTAKINLICDSWYSMISRSNSSEGFGTTFCGEWSQADTDCAKYLNNVGRGTRWEGTFNPSHPYPDCPTANSPSGLPCICSPTNADPSSYSSAYKKFLLTYAEAQMSAFETSEGWFYWTWRTESAAQWSYRTAWKNGFMPKKAYERSFQCGDDVPDFGDLPENY